MIAKYKGQYYNFVKRGETDEIVTNKGNKIDPSFYAESGPFHKEIFEKEMKDISDIFSVDFFIKHEFDNKELPDTWRVEGYAIDHDVEEVLVKSEIKHLEGWIDDGDGGSMILVPVSEIKDCWAVYKYRRQKGVTLFNELIEEVKLEPKELVGEYQKYLRYNL